MSQAPDTLLDDLLTCVLAIAMDTSGVKSGSKLAYELPKEPYLRVITFFGPIAYEYIAQSYDVVVVDVQITVRLIGGPLGTGYTGEVETRLNQTLFALVNRFAKAPFLQDPITHAPFNYLQNTPPPRLMRSPGVTGFAYGDPQNPTRFFGADHTLDVRLITPRV